MSHQAATTMKHIPNPSPALKKAAKDIKPGIAGYRDRIDMLKAGGVKEEIENLDELSKTTLGSYAKKASRDAVITRKIGADFEHQSKRAKSPGMKAASDDIAQKYKEKSWKRRDGVDKAVDRLTKEEIELDEVKMADLPSTKVQGRSYGASKPQPSAFDLVKGPKNKELTAIDAEKKKKKISEMIAIYKEGGLKTFFESIKKEDLIIEEPDSEQFAKDLEDAKKRASGTKPQPDVAKASVQAVKQEAVEQDIYVIDADAANGIDQVDIEERHMTGGEMNKREDIVKSMKKGMPGFKERYGDRAKNVMYATATKQAMKD
jgi:hypothetical protein